MWSCYFVQLSTWMEEQGYVWYGAAGSSTGLYGLLSPLSRKYGNYRLSSTFSTWVVRLLIRSLLHCLVKCAMLRYVKCKQGSSFLAFAAGYLWICSCWVRMSFGSNYELLLTWWLIQAVQVRVGGQRSSVTQRSWGCWS